MAQPTRSDVHVNAPLTNMSFAYAAEFNTVHDKMFPNVPSDKQANSYYVYTKDDWYRIQARERAPGDESAGSGYRLGTDTFACKVFALHKDVDDQIRANADEALDVDADATRFVTQQLLMKREYDFAARFFATGVWTGTSTGSDITPGTKWDTSSGDPIKDIRLQMKAMQTKTGYRPNTMAFGRTAWDVVLDNAAVIDRIKGGATAGNPAVVNEQTVAGILGLKRIFVTDAIYNSANEGATASMNFMFTGDSALLCYVPDAPGLYTPSAGYTFTWRQYLAMSSGTRIFRFRIDERRSDRIEGESAYDMKIVAADLGCLFVSVDT